MSDPSSPTIDEIQGMYNFLLYVHMYRPMYFLQTRLCLVCGLFLKLIRTILHLKPFAQVEFVDNAQHFIYFISFWNFQFICLYVTFNLWVMTDISWSALPESVLFSVRKWFIVKRFRHFFEKNRHAFKSSTGISVFFK